MYRTGMYTDGFNWFLFALLGILLTFMILEPCKVVEYPRFVNWETMISLTALLVLTSALKYSNYFNYIAYKFLKNFKTERSLALFLILFSGILSTFLTNDITLFIVVPITLSMQDLIKNDLNRLVIMEALAVNVGSTLTPIGNPQNLFLWYKWKLSFISFVFKMLPVVIIMLLLLVSFVFLLFPKRDIELTKSKIVPNYDTRLFKISLTLLIVFVVALELKHELLAMFLVLFVVLLYDKRIFKTVDFLLLLMFALIFVDFHLISELTFIKKLVYYFNMNSPKDVFLFSLGVSQVMSNVPASVFVSKFSNEFFAITAGVNVGGNGFILGSLANLIAVRLANKRGLILKFHKISLPFFFISAFLICILIF
ncbi:MAG: citrate transporter [Thermodesulfobacteria bacterium]|nr:citrate transporter [Thermodesulfobacteriota bacterium]